jgi:hypothetical protein
MAQSSRFEGQQIVNSINFFVDSERSAVVGDTQSKGDDMLLGFEGNTIECKDGEVIRLSLVDFHMPNNQYNIDARNSQGVIICTVNGTAMTAGLVTTLVTRGNYYDTDDLSFLSLLKICCYGLFFMILSFVLTVLFICLLAYLIR